MNASPRFLVLAALFVTAGSAGVFVTACSSSTNNPKDGGTDAAKDVAVKKEAGPTPEAGVDDSGQPEPTVDPLCAPADAAASNGSCVVRDDAGNDCNPVTNDGCDFVDAGAACDTSAAGFSCYNSPPNTAALCATCDLQNGPACVPGHTCVLTADAGAVCARYCCTDSDCTPGHCDLTTLQNSISPAGVCVK